MGRWSWVRETQTWHLSGDVIEYEYDDDDNHVASQFECFCDPERPRLRVPEEEKYHVSTQDGNLPTPGLTCAECAAIVRGHEAI